jgi:hypothetical protein
MQLRLRRFHQNMYTKILSLVLLNREYVPSSNVLAANIVSLPVLENRICLFFHILNSGNPILTLTQQTLGFFFFASR